MLEIPAPDGQLIDGISLGPLLKDKLLPERPLYWHYPHYGNQGGDPSSVLMIGDWKLVHYWEDDHDELYHLGKDQGEQHDLAQSEAIRTANMREQLLGWLDETGADIPQNDPLYDSQADHARDERIRSKLWPRLERRRKELLSPGFQPNEDWWNTKLTKD